MGSSRAPTRLLALLRTACRSHPGARDGNVMQQQLQPRRTFHSCNPSPSNKQAIGFNSPLSDHLALVPGRGGWAAWAGGRESLRQRQRCHGVQGLPPLRTLATAAKSSLPAAPGKASLFSLQRWQGLQLGLPSAVGLQLRSLWQRYRAVLFALGAMVAVFVLWRTTFRLASFFVNITETLAEVGLLALAATIVAFAALYLRSLYTIDPTRVYRLAMYHLNTSPAVLEVMGAPLVGGDVRVTVMSAGGPRLKGLRLKYKAPRVQMMFKLAGVQRQGLVSMEVKKKKGKYVFKLLAVDVQSAGQVQQQQEPGAAEGAARIFVLGDKQYYERGGLIWDLRRPYLSALNMQDQFELEDEDEEQQAKQAKEQQREGRRQQQEQQQQPHETGSAPEMQHQTAAPAAAAATPDSPTGVRAAPSLWQRLWGSTSRALV